MCGPLVSIYADRISNHQHAAHPDTLTLFDVRQHALFNLGRALSYALVGAVFGAIGWLAIGSADTVAAAGNTVRGAVGVVVGVTILAAGIFYLRGRVGLPHGIPLVGPVVASIMGQASSRVDHLAGGPGIMGLGAIHGILPCPILYPAYLYALALGDPFRGGLVLFVLGLGTIPTVFAYGTILGSIGPQTRVRLHRLLGVAFIILAYIPIQHGLMLLEIVHLPHPPIPFFDPL